MKRPIAATATFLASLALAFPALAQQQPYPPQQPYPQQPYPQQQYPQQQYPQQQPMPQQAYPQQQYQQAPPQFVPQPMVAAASGATFGSQGQFILSADRLFGLSFWSSKLENNGAFRTDSGTAINLLWGDTTNIAGPYATPRLGLDYTVANSISLGGSIAFISRSGSTESGNGQGATTTVDRPTNTGFAFAPRFGYILSINPTIGIWLKGGITYFVFSEETKNGMVSTQTDTTSGFSLDLEPELVITPVPHFGFTAGLVGDIALSGTFKQEVTGANAQTVDNNSKINNFGLIFGLVGFI